MKRRNFLVATLALFTGRLWPEPVHDAVWLSDDTLYGLAYVTEELLKDSPISFISQIEAGFRDPTEWPPTLLMRETLC